MAEAQQLTEQLESPRTIEGVMGLWEAEPYSRYGSNEPYKVGEGDGSKAERDQVRAAFISGEIQNPVVSYPNLDQ